MLQLLCIALQMVTMCWAQYVLCLHACAHTITGKDKSMFELVVCLTLASAGYIVGFVIGWIDGEKSQHRKKVIRKKSDPTLCQDYSHLKKKVIMEIPSKDSLAYMYKGKVYDAEVVEAEVKVSKVN